VYWRGSHAGRGNRSNESETAHILGIQWVGQIWDNATKKGPQRPTGYNT